MHWLEFLRLCSCSQHRLLDTKTKKSRENRNTSSLHLENNPFRQNILIENRQKSAPEEMHDSEMNLLFVVLFLASVSIFVVLPAMETSLFNDAISSQRSLSVTALAVYCP